MPPGKRSALTQAPDGAKRRKCEDATGDDDDDDDASHSEAIDPEVVSLRRRRPDLKPSQGF